MKPKKIREYPCIVQEFLTNVSLGKLREAVDSLPLFCRKGIRLNSNIFASLIQKCATSRSIKEGKLVHIHLQTTGSKHPDTLLSNHLINMYAKCGDHIQARKLFDQMRDRNLYSWNNMLSGYAHLGMVMDARRLFDRMPFKDFVSWNTMVMAYVETELFDDALNLYLEFRRKDFGYNAYSFAGVLGICVKLRKLCLAKQLHCQVLIVGFLSNVVLSSSIIDTYAKCGEIEDASRLFDEMTNKDVRTWSTLLWGYVHWGDMKSAGEIFDKIPKKSLDAWNALISGYSQNGMGSNALNVFMKMNTLQIEPDLFTYNSCLVACASENLLEVGRQIHAHLITARLKPNTVVLSTLIDMYSNCGKLEAAKLVFDNFQYKEHVVLWNYILSALVHHHCVEYAIKMFIDMVRLGVTPDSVSFFIILRACNELGILQKGLFMFNSMILDYNIIPNLDHFECLIDLLKKMRSKPDDHDWDVLLDICGKCGNEEFGRLAAKHLVELEPRSPATYLLLSSIYAALGRWESAQEVRRLAKEKSLSWLEIERELQSDGSNSKLHSYSIQEKTLVEMLADQSSV